MRDDGDGWASEPCGRCTKENDRLGVSDVKTGIREPGLVVVLFLEK